ncbi:hmgb1 protein [Lynx pardinus]|uniref:Hmgb1 protein n=1 Tax=Lynx pardinus TaxID=191816 RepID=A0A485PEE0_LYNPA|nr:hmgb1 protein [Lynx pardinus]
MSAKKTGKFEDMAKVDKACYEREMKTYIPAKGETKKKFKDPNAPKMPPLALFSFCSVLRIAQKSKGCIPACPLVMLQRNQEETWYHSHAYDTQSHEKKAVEPKDRQEKDVVPYRGKESLMRPKKKKKESSWLKIARKRRKRRKMKWRRKKRKMKIKMMNKLLLEQLFFLFIKHLPPCTQLAPFKEKKK